MAQKLPSGMYPLDTPITQMGLNAAETSMLTANAKKLNKKNLLILQNTAKAFGSQGEDKVVAVFDQRTGMSLTVGDIASVADAFEDMQHRRDLSVAAADACCCCTCCPCCSCTASVVIEATR